LPTTEDLAGLLALGWDEGWASALAALDDPALCPARVSRVDRGMCTVLTGAAEVRLTTEWGVQIAVGDWVGVGVAEGRRRIVAVLPRRGVFRRAAGTVGAPPQIVAANIDTVFVCDALDGTLSLRHLERFLALAWQSGAVPVVVITKSDTLPPATVGAALDAVRSVAEGIRVIPVSSATGEGVADLAPYLVAGRTVALLGLSGAGSGRHTTTHRQLVLLPGGGLLIDTPGMRGLSVAGAADGVGLAFQDLEELALDCTYAKCSHSDEPGCALLAAVSDGRLDPNRLRNWLRLRSEQPVSSELDAARRDVAERKRRKAAKFVDRRTARTLRSVEPSESDSVVRPLSED
jgi:ribosome biogenesis GTPase